jgi:hypothetical protein
MQSSPLKNTGFLARWGAVILLALVLSLLFWRSFLPDFIHFSNDGPLGQEVLIADQLPSGFSGAWGDSQYLGSSGGVYTPGIMILFLWLVGPIGFAKFLAPFAMFILGTGAWCFFRQLKLSPLAVILGALAAMLNSTFFATACWGVASQQIAMGMNFYALALIVAAGTENRGVIRWLKIALAGLCVGINVIEAADIGALCSMSIAAFVFYQALTERDSTMMVRAVRGVGRVAVIALFAGFIAFQAVFSLVGIHIQGISGTSQDTETKAQHWDWATQWSLPKKETLGIVVPGLFGYKMDTPRGMMPLPPAPGFSYEGGNYWGGIGREPSLDRFLDAGGTGNAPSGFMRFTGGGNYCGILVALIAIWAAAQALRKQNSVFSETQKRWLWFWILVAAISLPLAWGRFAPGSKSSDDFLFYAFLYKLPYFSTIRNPAKFLNFLAWALVILFAFGIDGLSRSCLNVATKTSAGPVTQIKSWWAKGIGFDRQWAWWCLGAFAASVIATLIYFSKKDELVSYLEHMGFGDPRFAGQIAEFSLAQAGWFVGLFAVALGLLTLVLAGYFAGKRARIGGILLGVFLLFDLVRADLPYIIHWDYKQKYEISATSATTSSNPVLEFLRVRPYEHRVAKLLPAPLSTPADFNEFDTLYEIEWKQHSFLYFGIQCFDIIQMSRVPEDVAAFEGALRLGIKQNAEGQYMLDETTFPKLTRKWELTNTRYLLGPAPFLDVFNAQFDPGKGRLRIVQRFDVLPKPGINNPYGVSQKEFTRYLPLEQVTAVPSNDGDYALFEFTGALPRAQLYSNWQVSTNDPANLKLLADPAFDPAKTVLVSTPQSNLPAAASNANTGTVTFTSYSPKHIVLSANATGPSVLLLNDRYEPNWHVTVDGQPASLLRCNFIMRGVYLPAAGQHTVDFRFELPNHPLFVTLAAMVLSVILCGILAFIHWKRQTVRS